MYPNLCLRYLRFPTDAKNIVSWDQVQWDNQINLACQSIESTRVPDHSRGSLTPVTTSDLP